MKNTNFPIIDTLSLRDELIRNKELFFKLSKTTRIKKLENPEIFDLEIEKTVNLGLKGFRSKRKCFIEHKIKEKLVYSYSNIGTIAVDKIISRYLAKIYNLKLWSRDEIMSILLHHLREPTSYGVLRLDIKNFYETINTKELLKELQKTELQLKHLSFIKSTFLKAGRGIKRGLPLSQVLSEICLQNLDEIFRQTNGIFFYARFVDDIIIIYDGKNKLDINQIKEITNFLTKYKLEFHSDNEKEFNQIIPKINKKTTYKDIKFDYLGYQFKIKNEYSQPKERQYRSVEVDLSEKTFKKFKQRLEKSFSIYHNQHITNPSQSYKLLDKRISYLTSNYRLFNQRKRVTFINGIYYGFRAINNSKGRLTELDNLLRYLIRREQNNSESYYKNDLELLNRHSFIRGFSDKSFLYFSVSSLNEIRKCWKNI